MKQLPVYMQLGLIKTAYQLPPALMGALLGGGGLAGVQLLRRMLQSKQDREENGEPSILNGLLLGGLLGAGGGYGLDELVKRRGHLIRPGSAAVPVRPGVQTPEAMARAAISDMTNPANIRGLETLDPVMYPQHARSARPDYKMPGQPVAGAEAKNFTIKGDGATTVKLPGAPTDVSALLPGTLNQSPNTPFKQQLPTGADSLQRAPGLEMAPPPVTPNALLGSVGAAPAGYMAPGTLGGQAILPDPREAQALQGMNTDSRDLLRALFTNPLDVIRRTAGRAGEAAGERSFLAAEQDKQLQQLLENDKVRLAAEQRRADLVKQLQDAQSQGRRIDASMTAINNFGTGVADTINSLRTGAGAAGQKARDGIIDYLIPPTPPAPLFSPAGTGAGPSSFGR